jgi:hypothetical protein
MAEEVSKQKRSAFVQDEKIDKMNRVLRKDALVEDDKVLKKGSGKPSENVIDSSRKVIKAEQFQFNAKPYVVGEFADAKTKEPEVEVIKDTQGQISKIKVKCVCGREVNIDCVY